jgi:hypothetical protein
VHAQRLLLPPRASASWDDETLRLLLPSGMCVCVCVLCVCVYDRHLFPYFFINKKETGYREEQADVIVSVVIRGVRYAYLRLTQHALRSRYMRPHTLLASGLAHS